MTLTRHGHHIPGTPNTDEPTIFVTYCGGSKLCRQCAEEISDSLLAKYINTPQERVTTAMTNFQDQAKQAVVDYFNSQDENEFVLDEDDVFIVWFCKTLQNWKALLCTNLPDVMYYELTYNGDKKELYLDAYTKVENVVLVDVKVNDFSD